jgi:hypothetical protein
MIRYTPAPCSGIEQSIAMLYFCSYLHEWCLRHCDLSLLQSVNVSIVMYQFISNHWKMVDSLELTLTTANSVHLWEDYFWFQVSDWLMLLRRSGGHRASMCSHLSCTSLLSAILLSMTPTNDLWSKSLTHSSHICNQILSGIFNTTISWISILVIQCYIIIMYSILVSGQLSQKIWLLCNRRSGTLSLSGLTRGKQLSLSPYAWLSNRVSQEIEYWFLVVP